MRDFVLFFCFFISSIYAYGIKIATFNRNYKNPILEITAEYIYIWDRKSLIIDLYSGKDYHYLLSFGRSGEGPKEFKFIRTFKAYPDFVFVDAGDKIVYFSKKGEFIKEIKPPILGYYLPIKDGFISRTTPQQEVKYTININYILIDSNFKKTKKVYSTNIKTIAPTRWELLLIPDTAKCEVYNDRIYIGDTTRGFFFSVFDSKGKKLFEIKLPYKKILITEREKHAYYERLKSWHGNRVHQVRLLFPDYFPAYNDFMISDDKIYVLRHVTDPLKAKNQEVYVLGIDGKLLKKANINYSPSFSFYFHKNNYYYLNDNEESEEWELYMEEIN
jgi:hypothetical protein